MKLHTIEVNEVEKLKTYKHFTTGISKFDSTKSITDGDFIILGGGTGSGKSTIALFMACNIAKSGETVWFFNMENTDKVMADSIEKLGFNFNSDFGEREKDHSNRLKIWTSETLHLDSLINKLELEEQKPAVIFIDLFSCLYEHHDEIVKWREATKCAIKLAQLSKKYGICVIVTEQFKKDNKRTGRAVIDDIKGIAELTTKATKVFIIYRYHKNNLEKMVMNLSCPEILSSTTELIVRKDRLGLLSDGISLVRFKKDKGFKSLSMDEIEAYGQLVFNFKQGKQ